MINHETVKALRALRLPGMAKELESQLEQPHIYKDFSFEDRVAMLVDAEGVSRKTNAVKRRLSDSNLSEKQASIEAIEYYEDRTLEKYIVSIGGKVPPEE